jgi:transposase
MTRPIAGTSPGVGWVADHDGVIHHDPVGVVDDLGLVAELDGVADAALADRAGVKIVQADLPAPDNQPSEESGGTHLARELGVHPEALRNWIRQDEADRGERDDRLTTEQLEELRRLRKENAELRRTNDILKAASAVFAQELDPTRRRS